MTAAAPGMRPIAEMGTRTKVLVMTGTLLGLFTSAMDQTVVGTSMPRIIADLGGFGLFSWVGTGFMLAATTTVPIVGKLTDLYGRKPFYMLGVFTLLLGSALCGTAQNVEQLIAFRVVQGLGAGMIMGIAFAIVGDVFTPAERGRWAGLMSGVFASASVLGPLIGGTLTDHVGWRWVFYVNIPMGAVALTVLYFGMPNIRPAVKAKLDFPGMFLLVATVVPMLLAFSWAGSRYDWLSFQVVGFLSWAVLGLALFVWAEFRADEPLLPISLFKNRVFLVSAVVTVLTGFAMFGSLFYIPLFVQGVIGTSATNSGLVVMPMMIAMAIASAIAGQMMSRFGRYRVLGVFGLLMMMAGMFLLSRMDVNATTMDARMAMVVFGIGLGTSLPLFMLAVQNAVPYRQMGISTSTMQFLRSVGGTMGIAVMFSLIQAQYHDELQEHVPPIVKEQPQLTEAMRDPQFLLNPMAFEQVHEAFQMFGERGEALFSATIAGVQESLAVAIADTFFVAIFILGLAVIAGLFMKEVPLRKAHYVTEEAPSAAGPAVATARGEDEAPGAPPAVRPVEGGANGGTVAQPGRGSGLLGPFMLLVAVVALVGAITARLGRRD